MGERSSTQLQTASAMPGSSQTTRNQCWQRLTLLGFGKQRSALAVLLLPTWRVCRPMACAQRLCCKGTPAAEGQPAAKEQPLQRNSHCKGTTCCKGTAAAKEQPAAEPSLWQSSRMSMEGGTWVANALTKEGDLGEYIAALSGKL